ncbi:hypothetical protein BGZ65_008711, partial [Modicella reniformis]
PSAMQQPDHFVPSSSPSPSPSTLVSGKKGGPAPPPPTRRNRVGVPITTLPASATIHCNKDVSVRRTAPPPPKRTGAGGASRTETDDGDEDDDDDDIDDDDDDDDKVDNNKRGTSTPDRGNSQAFLSAKDTKAETDGKMSKVQEAGDPEEVLVKPSQLKKQQQQQQQPIKSSGGLSVGSTKNVSLSTSPSSSWSPLLPPVVLSAVTTNKSKVPLPELVEQQQQQHGTGPLVASMGLRVAGNSPKGPSISKSSVSPSSSPSSSSSSSSAAAIVPRSIGKERVESSEETEGLAQSPPSVSELKKSFTVGAAGAAAAATTATATTTTSKNGKPSPKTTTTTTTSTGASTTKVVPVIPMVKPLSFSTTTTTTSGLSSMLSSTLLSRPDLGPGGSKVKVAVGSAHHQQQQHSIGPGKDKSKDNRINNNNNNNNNKSEAVIETEVKEVMPVSGSVKQAIAALKAGGGGGGETATTA